MTLAEIPYPRIDPDILHLGQVTVRWYGVSYILAFVTAFFVLRMIARRERWPVPADRVADVLFWGILGVFLGGRIGWLLFYGVSDPGYEWAGWWQVCKGGMSFHGGLAGVVIAYWIYVWKTKKAVGAFFDGLALAAPLGIFWVRVGNFVNAELYGRVWDGPWAMRFPLYERFGGPQEWEVARDAGTPRPLYTEPRHPSQLYEGLGEGLLLFFFLLWLMLGRKVGDGRIAATFLVGYGLVRFFLEYVRQPDSALEGATGAFTRGQQLSASMIVAGLVVFGLCAWRKRKLAGGSTLRP